VRSLAWVVTTFVCAVLAAASPYAGESPSLDARGAAILKVSEWVVSVDSKRADGRKWTASGIIWDGDGSVVTVAAVVGSNEAFEVVTRSGDRFAAELVGVDGRSAIAVLTARGLKVAGAASLSPGNFEVGDDVIAVGHPFGHGASTGVAGDMTRVAGSGGTVWMIQTTAPVLPGDVGGVLANARGEVIGLLAGKLRGSAVSPPIPRVRLGVRQIAVGSAQPQPVSFALPVDVVEHVAGEILEHGQVRRAWLGVAVASPRVLKTGAYLVPTSGALVVGLAEASPAEIAGMAFGDVIVKAAGREVQSPLDLERSLLAVGPGDSVAITIVRNGGEKGLGVTAVERAPEREEVWTCNHGLKIREGGLILAGAWPGVEIGDKLVGVNGGQVESLAALQIALAHEPQGLTVLRDDKLVYLPAP